jgi:hypothetical protein
MLFCVSPCVPAPLCLDLAVESAEAAVPLPFSSSLVILFACEFPHVLSLCILLAAFAFPPLAISIPLF